MARLISLLLMIFFVTSSKAQDRVNGRHGFDWLNWLDDLKELERLDRLAPMRTFSDLQKDALGGGIDKNAVVECGKPAVPPKEPRIVGGSEARPHSWPWAVSVIRRRHDWQHWCGGTIVSPHWVVSAAHCILEGDVPADFRVVVGEHALKLVENTERTVDVEKVIVHEAYNTVNQENDIALLRVAKDIEFNDYARPACLPRADPLPGIDCVVTGWGETYGTGDASVLNQVHVPIIDQGRCNEGRWYHGDVLPNMMCAGFESGRHDTCKQDSGGGLVCPVSDRWHLQGVVSWGDDCAEPRHPGVYTRVNRYTDWIRDQTDGELVIPDSEF